MRYFLHLSYDGTNYCGWQVQANAPSVQQTINEALYKLLQQGIKSLGCGRTDTGVHAKDFYMHFTCEKTIADVADFVFRLNCVLPDDISIYRLLPVTEQANARFDAYERTYEYFIYFDKSPFLKKYAFYQGFYHIDWEPMMAAAEFLKGVEDFSSLCLPSDDFKTNICYLKKSTWDLLPAQHLVLRPYDETETYTTPDNHIRPGQVVRFTITSNRFLRGMVRKIVGTMLMVGKGKITLDEFCEVVSSRHPFRIHHLAPPNGLFLSQVKYPYL